MIMIIMIIIMIIIITIITTTTTVNLLSYCTHLDTHKSNPTAPEREMEEHKFVHEFLFYIFLVLFAFFSSTLAFRFKIEFPFFV